MKKLGFAVMLAAVVAFVAVGSAAARNGSGSGSSKSAPQSSSHASAHGDDHGSGKGSDDGAENTGQREPGEDVRGNCDEAEHANDAGCAAAPAAPNSSGASLRSTLTSKSSAGQAAGAVAAGKRLVASVGPGFSISLKTAAGAAVKTLRAGTYTVLVRDRSPEHNFHLAGRAVNKSTSPGSVSTSTWRVRFAAGTYNFMCDPHADAMRGSIRVV
jgi:plastocyanin